MIFSMLRLLSALFRVAIFFLKNSSNDFYILMLHRKKKKKKKAKGIKWSVTESFL